MKNATVEIKRDPSDVCAVIMVVRVVNELLSVPVFTGFGIMPLVCAGIIWTLLGRIPPLSSGLDFTGAS